MTKMNREIKYSSWKIIYQQNTGNGKKSILGLI